MFEKVINSMIFTVAAIFGLLALSMFFFSPMISEIDDILVVQIFGFPSLFLAVALGAQLDRSKCFGYFLIIWILVFLSALFAMIGGFSGIVDIVSFQDKLYIGLQENDFSSFDLFLVGAFPTIMLLVLSTIRIENRVLAEVFNREALG